METTGKLLLPVNLPTSEWRNHISYPKETDTVPSTPIPVLCYWEEEGEELVPMPMDPVILAKMRARNLPPGYW